MEEKKENMKLMLRAIYLFKNLQLVEIVTIYSINLFLQGHHMQILSELIF